MIGTPSISSIFHLVTAKHVHQNQQEVCRLNDEGWQLCLELSSWLAINATNTETFMQLCSYVHSLAGELAQMQMDKQHNKNVKLSPEHQKTLQRLVACLQGMCATPGGLDRVLRELFDGSCPCCPGAHTRWQLYEGTM